MPAQVHKDAEGTLWRVPAFSPKDSVKFQPVPHIEVWWNRPRVKTKRADELLVLRQCTDEDREAEVIMLSLGQVYDLIDALNKAVEGI